MQKISDPSIPAQNVNATLPVDTKRVMLFLNMVRNITFGRDENNNFVLTQYDNLKNRGFSIEFDVSTLKVGQCMFKLLGNDWEVGACIRFYKNADNVFTFELWNHSYGENAIPGKWSETNNNYYEDWHAITEVWAE